MSHLLFADDSLLFFKAGRDNALKVKEVLDKFCLATGQSINPTKCSILFGEHCPEEVMAETCNTLLVQNSGFEPKYLGLPTPEGRMKKERFQPLRERLVKRMVIWSEKDLSQGAREVLIKSVAQAIPTYTMSVFKLQDGVIHELEQMIRRYWWGAKNGKRKTHWVAWEKMLKTKDRGGMGFQDLKLFNQALLARQAWRLVEFPKSLCARVLKAK